MRKKGGEGGAKHQPSSGQTTAATSRAPRRRGDPGTPESRTKATAWPKRRPGPQPGSDDRAKPRSRKQRRRRRRSRASQRARKGWPKAIPPPPSTKGEMKEFPYNQYGNSRWVTPHRAGRPSGAGIPAPARPSRPLARYTRGEIETTVPPTAPRTSPSNQDQDWTAKKADYMKQKNKNQTGPKKRPSEKKSARAKKYARDN